MLLIAMMFTLFVLVVLVAQPKNKIKLDQTEQTLQALQKQEKELYSSIQYQQDVHATTLDILNMSEGKVEALKLQASDEQANIQQTQEKLAQVQSTIIALGGT